MFDKRAYQKIYRQTHKKEIKIYKKAYYQKHSKVREYHKAYQEKYIKDKPWARTWGAINGRCNNLKHRNYYRYGGRGIKNFLTMADLEYLWFRDKAYNLKRPSIDRIDNDGDYTIENCQYIEFSHNLKKKNLKNGGKNE